MIQLIVTPRENDDSSQFYSIPELRLAQRTKVPVGRSCGSKVTEVGNFDLPHFDACSGIRRGSVNLTWSNREFIASDSLPSGGIIVASHRQRRFEIQLCDPNGTTGINDNPNTAAFPFPGRQKSEASCA
jgi:hypothetical protein